MMDWLRLKPMGGWNPFFSPSRHFAHHWGKGFEEGVRKAQELERYGTPEEKAAAQQRALESVLSERWHPTGIRLGNTIFYPAPYENVDLGEEDAR